MTDEQLAQTWVPVSIPWRLVVPGDVMIAPDGAPWAITDCAPRVGSQWWAVAVRGANQPYEAPMDPDDRINVLVAVTERDAVELSMDELGARLIERRAS
jgi:hypothetical protein